MLRVDFESAITEKDKDSGYFFFNFADDKKSHPGSFEVIRVQDTSGVETVRVVVQVPALPSYVEQMLLDRLARKLGQDYGQPPQAKAPPPTTGAAPEPGRNDANSSAGGTNNANANGNANGTSRDQAPKNGGAKPEAGKSGETAPAK